MSLAGAAVPRLVHATRGRVRIHVPEWEGGGPRQIEAALRQIPGVYGVQANPLTGNVLVRFDHVVTGEPALVHALQALAPTLPEAAATETPPPVLRERHGSSSRVRIAVRGLDRDPALAQYVVRRLQRRPGVKLARASSLTGRVLIEYDEHLTDLEDLIAEVSGLELPDLIGEDRPAHPLDPAPLIQSVCRTIGAGLGLGLLAARRLLGFAGPPVAGAMPGQVAGVIGILQGFPITRNGLRSLLGRNLADLLFQGAAIVSLALSGSPLGLAVTGSEGLRLLTEVVTRRAAWRRYEAQLGTAASAQPGDVIRLESGEHVPLAGTIVEGTGTGAGRDGLPEPIRPGARITAGARLYGGPFVVELEGGTAFTPQPRTAPIAPELYEHYLRLLGPISLGYAAFTGVTTRSLGRTFAALLLVNPRTALIGKESADISASARVLRAGVTVVGTRPERVVRLPHVLLIHGSRALVDGFELSAVLPLTEVVDAPEILGHAVGVAVAAGSPWSGALAAGERTAATEGSFDGAIAAATIGGVRYTLRPAADGDALPAAARMQHRGNYLLVLEGEHEPQPLGLLVLRSRLAPGASELIQTCRRHGVEIELIAAGDSAATHAVARRVGVLVGAGRDAVTAIRARQAEGAVVAFASDSADDAAAFAAADLAIGITDGRSRLPARADLLAPDLGAIAAIVEAGARRGATIRDSVALSVVANGVGAVWGFQGSPGVERASRAVYIMALAALADGWARLRGGRRPRSALAHLTDPRPERWGRRSIADVLKTFGTTESGLTTAEAAGRAHRVPVRTQHFQLFGAVLDQVRSPLTAILAAGAGLSAVLGSTADVIMIGSMIVANAAIGVWQERQAGRAAEALERMGAATARVLRDGRAVTVAAADVVPGDVLLLAPGHRVAADARVLSAHGLEVDEAALTGESLPAAKSAAGGPPASHVVLEGSDVTVGTARAAVVAVGHQTRLGATAAALAIDETEQSPLGVRLSRLLRQFLPIAAAGAGLVVGAGLLRGQALLSQLAIGTTLALTAVPEGLPLLAGVGEAGVARRLAGRNALVRRLAAIEALGRVDVACSDKTGTLTEGRLALQVVSDGAQEARLPGALPEDLCHVLLTGALASPHPEASDAAAHPTDVAVADGAVTAGLEDRLRVQREQEAPFDPARSFHAAVVGGRLCVKGAAEALMPRCAHVRRAGGHRTLDPAGRVALLEHAQSLAARGLRVLMVAEGDGETSVQNPQNLVALGFLGISDPLRPGVPAAILRCREAGIRLIMLTGDHPATARAIAHDAGLPGDDGVITGAEIAALDNGELDRRLERATVIARITPLDKLRIVESLQRSGHTVAMTGDGVNDAPALRLADVGVAMGRGGTEVARQAADVVLADDDFATLVEALVEGRSFWRNIRRALGLLLGGNLGELGLMVGASVVGLASPLVARQVLAVNLITDALPALAVALQEPEHRHLAALAREGEAALDAPLRREVMRRGIATAVPSLLAYVAALGTSSLPEARTVAFASIVATQLAQTLDSGRTAGGLSRAVTGAVGSSAALLLAAVALPPVRGFLQLVVPTPLGWLLVGAATLAAIPMGRALPALRLALAGASPALLDVSGAA